MRLVTVDSRGRYGFESFNDDDLPPYAILSHTWGTGEQTEVTFKDIVKSRGERKAGYDKLEFCKKRIQQDGFRYFWIDTCAINKSDPNELTTAINSMFRWYRRAAVCYVYLSDISLSNVKSNNEGTSEEIDIAHSNWFTRGWTLQELLASKNVVFYSRDGTALGTKEHRALQLAQITGIPIEAFRSEALPSIPAEDIIGWVQKRRCTRPEDKAYCLLGLLNITMSPLYGEGEDRAFERLREEVAKKIARSAKNESTHKPLAKLARFDLPKGRQDSLHAAYSRDEFIEALHFEQMDARRFNIKHNTAKTCEWISDDGAFRTWIDVSDSDIHPDFLWIKGKPGSGKSTLIKYIWQHLREKFKDYDVLSFFFNARGVRLERTTLGLYRSMIIQLLHLDVAAFEKLEGALLRQIRMHGVDNSLELLKSININLVRLLFSRKIIIIIDALDECSEKEIRDMISLWQDADDYATESTKQLRFLFSSRHYPEITIRKSQSIILEDHPGHKEDLKTYIDRKLVHAQHTTMKEIVNTILSRSSGIFMWVVLVVDILNEEIDHGHVDQLRHKLNTIPPDLSDLFRGILSKDAKHLEELKLCLQWVLFTEWPLTPEELYFAVQIGLGNLKNVALQHRLRAESTSSAVLIGLRDHLRTVEEDEQQTDGSLSIEDMKTFILSSSKGLAEVTMSKDWTVQFIHESVRDYLLKDNGLAQLWVDHPMTPEGASHEVLKHCCSTYISNLDIDLIVPHLELNGHNSDRNWRRREDNKSTFPLLTYAVENMFEHSDAAQQAGIDQARFLEDFDLGKWIQLHNVLQYHQWELLPPDVDLVYVLAWFDCAHLIESVSERVFAALQNQNLLFQNPILVALAKGSAAAFAKLVTLDQSRENWNGKLPYECTHLGNFLIDSVEEDMIIRFLEVYRGEHEAILTNIFARLKLNSSEMRHDTPVPLDSAIAYEFDLTAALVTAVGNDDSRDMLLILLSLGADIDGLHGNVGTALIAASRDGNKKTTEYLLDHGAKVNVCGGEHHSPLIAVASAITWSAQRSDVISLLLRHDADVTACGGEYGTALIAASLRGHMDAVSLLIENGSDVNAVYGYYGTALIAAVQGQRPAAILLLLQKGADVNIASGKWHTALQASMLVPVDYISEMLINFGADASITGGQHGSALRAAVHYKRTARVSMLLDKCVHQIDKHGTDFTLAIDEARNEGYEDISSLLIAHKSAIVDVQSGSPIRKSIGSQSLARSRLKDVFSLLNAHRSATIDVKLGPPDNESNDPQLPACSSPGPRSSSRESIEATPAISKSAKGFRQGLRKVFRRKGNGASKG